MKVGILYSRVRAEEKLIFEAFERRGVDLELLDDLSLELIAFRTQRRECHSGQAPPW